MSGLGFADEWGNRPPKRGCACWQGDASGEFLEMAAEDVNIDVLNAAGGELDSALNNPFFGAL